MCLSFYQLTKLHSRVTKVIKTDNNTGRPTDWDEDRSEKPNTEVFHENTEISPKKSF